MKIIKKLSFIVFLIIFLFPCILTHATETEYLEAKDYISVGTSDVSEDITGFLKLCKFQGKNAYFNRGVYRIEEKISLIDGVSILGEEGTIFQGMNSEYQSYIRDDIENVKDISIEHIIFDNVTIYFQSYGSTNILIKDNIFLNAKKVDLKINNGLNPDSSNKNGGESTGYYILKNHNTIEISSNLFLRDSNSLGRGIGLYKTENCVIRDNYFGMLEDISQSIVSVETKALKERALNTGLVNESSNQGHFMTGINVINSDVNTQIIGNYMSFNKDIVEAGYEDGSQSTSGYNRDHFIYAKMFNGLEVVGNYFKGMNKNQDGAIKFRNGENLFIYKNVLEDSLILLYVQSAQTNLYLKNVLVQENIFVNKDYSSKLVQIPSGDRELNKYLTIDYLILLKNYVQEAEISNITFLSNTFYSVDMKNEQIRIDNTGFSMPNHVTIRDNKNIVSKLARLTIRSTLNMENFDENQDYTNGVEYGRNIPDEYLAIDVNTLAISTEIPYQIQEGIITSSAEQIFVNGLPYLGESLREGEEYFIFLVESSSSIIQVENVAYTIPSHRYTAVRTQIQSSPTYTITYINNGHGEVLDQVNNIQKLPTKLPNLSATGYIFEGWYLDEDCTIQAQPGAEITSNLVLYASWRIKEFVIHFKNETLELETVLVSYQSLLKEPVKPVKDGYIFKGWSLEQDDYLEYNFDAEVTRDFTLYAHWIPRQYTITFQKDTLEILSTQIISYGEKLIEPQTPLKDGYSFQGWYLDLNDINAYDFEKAIVTSDFTLYAKWEAKKYNVIYFLNGQEVARQNVSYQTYTAPPTIEIPNGYRFEGWYKQESFDQSPFNFVEEYIVNDLVLYGKLERLTYTITYQMNGHGAPLQTIENALKIPTNLPNDLNVGGWRFEGWYMDEACTQLAVAGKEIYQNTTLYAKWTQVFVINFDVQGYGTAPAKITNVDVLPAELPNPSASDLVFSGWYLDAACTQAAVAGAKIISDITLYAKWRKQEISFKVTFHIVGTGDIAEVYILSEQFASRPIDFSMDGYDFDGWYIDDTCTEKWDFDETPITKDTTLYARWIPKIEEGSPSILIISIAFSVVAVILIGIGSIVFFLKRKR